MYNAAVGQFLEPDPIGPAIGENNLYEYCDNDPISLTDPTGLGPGLGEGDSEASWSAPSFPCSTETDGKAASQDWNFTPADYKALKKSGGSLTFAADSDWFPKKLQENLKVSLEYILTSTMPVRTRGVNIQDFYHGHVVVPIGGAQANEFDKAGIEFSDKAHGIEGKALGGDWINPVTSENIKAFSKAMTEVEKLSTPLLDKAIATPGASVFYHTFESNTPKGMDPDDPARNICTKIGESPNGVPGGDYEKKNVHVLQFAFLVDKKGVIHVTVGTIPNLSKITGTPLK